MKLNNKIITASLVSCLMLFTLASCDPPGSSSYDSSKSGVVNGAAIDSIGDSEYTGAESYSGNNSSGDQSSGNTDNSSIKLSQDKITYTSYYTLETGDYDSVFEKIENLISDTDSIVESKNSGINQNIRSASINVMVPIENYDKFKEELSSYCYVSNSRETADNITQSYTDTENRLKVAEERVDRLYELIKENKDSYQLASLYDELDSAQRDVERIKSSLMNMDISIAYCDVSVTLKDTHTYWENGTRQGDGSWVQDKLYHIYNSTEVFRKILDYLLTAIIYLAPYCVLILLLVGIFARKPEKLWDKLGRKKKAKKIKNKQNTYYNQPVNMAPPINYNYQQSGANDNLEGNNAEQNQE